MLPRTMRRTGPLRREPQTSRSTPPAEFDQRLAWRPLDVLHLQSVGVGRERRHLTILGVRPRLDGVARDEIAVMLGRQQTGMRQGYFTLGAAVVRHSDPGQGPWGLREAGGCDGDRARGLMDHGDDVVAGE